MSTGKNWLHSPYVRPPGPANSQGHPDGEGGYAQHEGHRHVQEMSPGLAVAQAPEPPTQPRPALRRERSGQVAADEVEQGPVHGGETAGRHEARDEYEETDDDPEEADPDDEERQTDDEAGQGDEERPDQETEVAAQPADGGDVDELSLAAWEPMTQPVNPRFHGRANPTCAHLRRRTDAG